MIAKLKGIEERFIKLEHLLSDPAVISDQKKYQKYLIEHGELNKIVPVFRVYERLLEEHKEAKELLRDTDSEIRTMAKDEIPELESNIEKLKSELNILLVPKDPRDGKNVLLEIRAGTGGEEAGIFAGDLFRMYSRYVESKNWTMEIVEKNTSSSGGFKEIVSQVHGKVLSAVLNMKAVRIVSSGYLKQKPREECILLQLLWQSFPRPKI